MKEPASESKVVVSARRITKIYHFGKTQVVALKEVDLDLFEGEFTALVGPSGAGKSTLTNIIGCIEVPSAGTLELRGANVQALSEKERAVLRNRYIGIVFQSFNLIPVLSVEENVELPMLLRTELTAQQRKQNVEQLLRDVGLDAYPKFRPDKLSGGQRQRVAIARALANSPSLVIADEPTANLDSETAHQIVDLMVDLNRQKNVTFLFSTHDEKLIRRVRRTITIRDGRLFS
jgi:putative ABC transport system ATP-binding protein